MTPSRSESMRHLTRIIKNALERKDEVELGGVTFTFRERGDQWDLGDTGYEAMANGIYQKASVMRNDVLVGHTYLFQGDLDDLEGFVRMVSSEMTLEQIEEKRFDSATSNVLKTMNPKRALPSESPSP